MPKPTTKLLLIALAVFGTAAFGWSSSRRQGRTPRRGDAADVATVAQLPQVVAALSKSTTYPAFVVFIFSPAGASADDAVNLQFSIEKGTLGLDWVLISPRNIADRVRLEQFIRARGHSVAEHVMNGTHYLRVEDGRVTELGGAILQEFYRLSPGTRLDLVVEGFDWSP